MLNVKNFSELLTTNVHPILYPHLFVMSPNGTLLAYSTPTNIKALRDQAALISLTWREHDPAIKAVAEHGDGEEAEKHNESNEVSPAKLETLTVECETRNILVRSIQRQILLVLLGGVPPARRTHLKITSEMHGEPPYPSDQYNSNLRQHATTNNVESGDDSSPPSPEEENPSSNSASPASSPDSAQQQQHLGRRVRGYEPNVLHLHRRKLDALAAYIKNDFERRGFVMPNLEDLGKPLV